MTALLLALALAADASDASGLVTLHGQPAAGAEVSAWARQPTGDILHLGCTRTLMRSELTCRCGAGAEALRQRLTQPSPAPIATTRADAEGHFHFDGSLPAWAVISARLGSAWAVSDDRASAGPISLALAEPPKLVGGISVEEDRGGPVRMTAVWLQTGLLLPVTVDRRSFTTALPPGRFALVALSDQPGLAPGIEHIDEHGRASGGVTPSGFGPDVAPSVTVPALRDVELNAAGWPQGTPYRIDGTCNLEGELGAGALALKLPPGQVRFAAHDATHFTQLDLNVKPTDGVQRFRGEWREGTRVTGRMTVGGKPAAKATINLVGQTTGTGSGTFVWATAAADGNYDVGPAEAGMFTVNASAEGGVSEQRKISLPISEPLDFDLAAMVPLRGQVVDTEGRGVGGVQVVAEGATPQQRSGARSEGDGQFTVIGLPSGDYTLSVSDPRWDEVKQSAQSGGPPVLITLGRRALVRGEVLTASGEPAAGVYVRAEYRTAHGQRSMGVQIGDDGTFLIAVPDETEVEVSASQEGAMAKVSTHSGPNPEALRLQLPAVLAVAGRIRTRDGRPLAGAWVWTNGVPPEVWNAYRGQPVVQSHLGYMLGPKAKTDLDGRFRIAGVQTGELHLQVDVAGLVLEKDAVIAGQKNLELVAVRDPEATATVVWPDGKKVAEFTLNQAPGKDGVIHLAARALQAPLRLTAPGALPVEVPLPKPNANGDLALGRLVLEHAATLEGAVTTVDGKPLSVEICQMEEKHWPEGTFFEAQRPCITTAHDGLFTLAIPPRGTLIRVKRGPTLLLERWLPAQTGLTLVAPDPARLTVTTEPVEGAAFLDVEGPLLDHAGVPRGNQRVLITDQAGKTELKELPAGDYRVRRRGSAWTKVTLSGGTANAVTVRGAR